jgi:hypothetical protein
MDMKLLPFHVRIAGTIICSIFVFRSIFAKAALTRSLTLSVSALAEAEGTALGLILAAASVSCGSAEEADGLLPHPLSNSENITAPKIAFDCFMLIPPVHKDLLTNTIS